MAITWLVTFEDDTTALIETMSIGPVRAWHPDGTLAPIKSRRVLADTTGRFRVTETMVA